MVRWFGRGILTAAAILFGGLAQAQSPLPVPASSAASAPASVVGLAGTEWTLKVRRTDSNDGFPAEDIILRFLPNGFVLVNHGAALYMPAWRAKGTDIVLGGEGMRLSLKFANGPTTGSGWLNLNGFEVTSLNYRGAVDLSSPFIRSMLKNDTCAFVGRAMHSALEGFWNLPQNGAWYELKGQGSSNRYGDVLAASVKGRSKDFKGVKAEYERRIADLSGCVVIIHERPYGLEMLNETAPANKDTFDVDTVFRLRDAPEYLSDLRVHVNGNWWGSPWVSVRAGQKVVLGEGPSGQMQNAEQRLIRKLNLQWTPVSTAPETPDPLASNSVGALEKAGDAIWALSKGDTKNIANWGARAIRYYHAACERGAMVACGRKATIMAKVRVGIGNTGRIRPLFEKGCSVGDADSCYGLAVELRKGDIASVYQSGLNVRRAIEMFEELCNKAHAQACGALASEVAGYGKFLDPDWPRASALYDKACALGEEFSCLTGGKIFYVGMEGVPKDWERARRMFTSGCSADNWLIAEACRYAGTMYYAGQGGAASEDLAKLMFKRGCDFTDADSCKALNLPAPKKPK